MSFPFISYPSSRISRLKKLKLCHTPLTSNAPLTQYKCNLNTRPAKPYVSAKAQTHATNQTKNCRNRNKHHPSNKSPTLVNFGTHAPRSYNNTLQHPSLQISRYNTSRTVSKIHIPTHPTKASQTADLNLPKFQTSSTPPQVKQPHTTNHLNVPTTPKPILKGSTKLTRPQKLKNSGN